MRGASVVRRGWPRADTPSNHCSLPARSLAPAEALVPGFLHAEDSASRLGGLQQGVPPGAQLDELCFGADLGVLGGARLWLGDGVRLLPLAGANEPRLNLAEWAQNGTPKMSGRR